MKGYKKITNLHLFLTFLRLLLQPVLYTLVQYFHSRYHYRLMPFLGLVNGLTEIKEMNKSRMLDNLPGGAVYNHHSRKLSVFKCF